MKRISGSFRSGDITGKFCCWFWELPNDPKRLRPYGEADLAETFDELTGQLAPFPARRAPPS